jgi:hypothetical protein
LAKDRSGQEQQIDPDKDRYPSIRKAIHAALQDEDFPQGDVERFEVTCLASGEATYRVWAARADEPLGGYLASVD